MAFRSDDSSCDSDYEYYDATTSPTRPGDPAWMTLHPGSPRPVRLHQLHDPESPRARTDAFPGPAQYSPQELPRRPPAGKTVHGPPRWMRSMGCPGEGGGGRRDVLCRSVSWWREPGIDRSPGPKYQPTGDGRPRPCSALGTIAFAERFGSDETIGPGPAGYRPQTQLTVRRPAREPRLRPADPASSVDLVTFKGLRRDPAGGPVTPDALADQLGVSLDGRTVVGVTADGRAERAGVCMSPPKRAGTAPEPAETEGAWEVYALSGKPVRTLGEDSPRAHSPLRVPHFFNVTLRRGCGLSGATLPRVRRRNTAAIAFTACLSMLVVTVFAKEALRDLMSLVGLGSKRRTLLRSPRKQSFRGSVGGVGVLQAVRATQRMMFCNMAAAGERKRRDITAAVLTALRLRCDIGVVVDYVANHALSPLHDQNVAGLNGAAMKVLSPCGAQYSSIRRRDHVATRRRGSDSSAGSCAPPTAPVVCAESLSCCPLLGTQHTTVFHGWSCASGCHWTCQTCLIQRLSETLLVAADSESEPRSPLRRTSPVHPQTRPPARNEAFRKGDWKGGQVVRGKRRYGGAMKQGGSCTFGLRIPEKVRQLGLPGPGAYDPTDELTRYARPVSKFGTIPASGSAHGAALKTGTMVSPCAYTPSLSLARQRSANALVFLTG